ncbi:DUF6443 domain-containing protein [Flavobacterium sp. KACC 22763]|uniref:DUF6443 domain-containing protein n=1 Tax=Flavobacterium sp. KACC 22763 TaxID=3025668 RepID=UPI0023663DB6|nr:DUF6443 domain-containing protein [Flavobacterium sp. KACC 22763]WDF64542.1 hypothetical protein PQ463_00010 [Flavobacterium sp. KACC 22763]
MSNASMFAQKNIYKAPVETYNSEQIKNINIAKRIVDPEIKIPNQISISPKAYIRLKVNSNLAPFVHAKTKVVLTVIPILPNGDEEIAANQYDTTLEVEYNPLGNSANFIDLSSHELTNRYGVKVIVKSYETNGTPNVLNDNVSLELGFESERYYLVTEQLANIKTAIIDDPADESHVALNFSWQPLVGALEYELEWTWVDNYGKENLQNTISAEQVDFSSRDFELNNTRVRTPNASYEIPLIYSKGFIIYRVRAVGRFLDDIKKVYYGPWSSGIANKTKVSDWIKSYTTIDFEHEDKKNWQFQASYAEQGKKKEVVSYFDGSLRNRQTVTKINTNDKAIVGEVIYDAQGRAAVEVLPTPINRKYIRYFSALNKNLNNELYSHLDFDWETTDDNSSTSITGMNSISGSSRYYSGNNDIDSPFRNFIPSASNFPFSQTEYTPDNTGRISRKGGVGPNHQLGTNHEMQYIYSVPNQEELNRLFGYEVGLASHYKKNIVIDPNKQSSVSYIDPQGKTIATALAGGASELNLDPLEDTNDESLHKKINIDLLNKKNASDANTSADNNELTNSSNSSGQNDALVVAKQLGVASNATEHYFSYSVENNTFFQPEKPINCNNKYGFVYDLNISLKDKTAKELFTPAITNKKLGNEYIGTSPSTIKDSISILPKKLSLNAGSYSLLKELKIDQEVLNKYADDYVAKITDSTNTSCYIKPTDFQSNTSVSICSTSSCSECTSTLGTEHEYVLKQLKALYNIPTEGNGSNLINISQTFVLTIGTNTFPEINFGQQINATEAAEFVNRFRTEWSTLSEFCEQLCGPTFTSGCTINEGSLLADVSPNGQYGLIKSDFEDQAEQWDSLSIFNDSTTNKIIYNGTTTDHNWRFPLPEYRDQDGNAALVEVIKNEDNITYSPKIRGSVIEKNGRYFVLPQNLDSIGDFLDNWSSSWAKSLIGYHPEFQYLQYTKAICSVTSNVSTTFFTNTGEVQSTGTKTFNSDEYDAYLNSLDTYAKAEAAGYFRANDTSTFNTIFTSDPYFSATLGTDYETSAIYTTRKDVMLRALNTQYESFTSTKMLQVALQMVKCNAIQTCDVSSISYSSLTESEKTKLWNTYRSLYISLKGNIKHVFMNLYATNKGNSNSCIGQNGSSDFTNVLKNYSTLVPTIKSYIAPPATTFCSNAAAVNYKNKEKRFIATDFAYDADVDAADAQNQLVAQTNYQSYVQTGNCPGLTDLNMFLSSLFNDVNLAGSSLTSWHNMGQGLSPKLFADFTGATLPLNVSSPTMNIQTSGASDLIFNFSPTILSGTALKLTLPAGSNVSWGNYSASNWHIISLTNIYYDAASSSLSGENPVFAYKVIARIQVGSDASTQKEIILSGTTLAKIGECHVNGVTGVGETLIPEGSDCTKKQQFSEALTTLLINLQVAGNLYNSDITITSDSTLSTNSFLYNYFGLTSTSSVKWNNTAGIASITVNGSKRVSIDLQGLPNPGEAITNVSIGSLKIKNEANILKITSRNSLGQPVIKLATISSGKAKMPLYLACCAPCGEWDKNGDGYGDSCSAPTDPCGEIDSDGDGFFDGCDTCPNIYNPNQEPCSAIPCSLSSIDEINYENTLKNVLNNFLLPGNHITNTEFSYLTSDWIPINESSNSPLNLFVNQNKLVQHWQAYRNKYTVNNFHPVAIDQGSILITSNATSLNFNEKGTDYNGNWISIQDINLFNAKHINNIDIKQGNTIEINFTDNNNNIITVATTRFLHFVNVYISETGSASAKSPTFCLFMTENYPNTLTSKMATSDSMFTSATINTAGEIEYKNNFSSKSSLLATPELSCTGKCIPQPVEPVNCDEKYELYQTSSFREQISKNDFCSANLQYLVDDYIKYLGAMGVRTMGHYNYLSIRDFGDTDLHYGYKNMDAAIAAYKTYNDANANNEDKLFWKDFINTKYVPSMTDCPPAIMPFYSISVPAPENSPCEELKASVSGTYQTDSYNKYIASLRQDFIDQYTEKAMSTVVENFNMNYSDKEYQYTLYYYDQAGNLIKTIAPEGVKRLSAPDEAATLTLNQNINNIRSGVAEESEAFLPKHTFKTEYKYNSLNQLVWQQTPDGGITRFAYDKLGRIIASQNAKQINSTIEPGLQRFSYTNYDYLGRIIEAGEIHVTNELYRINDTGKLLVGDLVAEKFDDSFDKTEVSKTIYTEDPQIDQTTKASTLFTTNTALGFNPADNNRNRVTAIYYYNTYNKSTPLSFDNAIFYNYDVHGNVKELLSYNAYLKSLGCNSATVIDPDSGLTNDCEAYLKRVVYNYDLISGNVNTVVFQPTKADQFIHKYNYDADNRIVDVSTSNDGVIWEKDADYQYYPHGPLARVQLGDKNVQGIDYAYTLHGWLKAVNGENISDASNDIGNDGTGTKTKDAFGYSLSYYDKDYKAIANDDESQSYKPLMFSRDNSIVGNIKDLYNGNIKQMTTAIRKKDNELLPVQKNNYTYDQLNRIKSMNSQSVAATKSGHDQAKASYGSDYTYDRNGNLKTLNRSTPLENGDIQPMDQLTYEYATGNNRLNKVFDAAADVFSETGIDIKQNISQLGSYNKNNTNTHNYIYDAIGQLVEDKSEGLKIDWRVDGKVKKITKKIGSNNQIIAFEYDGLGNRITKKVFYENTPTNATTTLYSRDAQGNELAVYNLNESSSAKSLVLKEHHIFGSSRLGLEESDKIVYQSESVSAKKIGKSNLTSKSVAQNEVAGSTNALTQNVAAPLNLPFVAAKRDYALSFNANTIGNWFRDNTTAIQNNADLTKIELDTRFKLQENADFSTNASYGIAQLEYKEIATILPYNKSLVKVPEYSCVEVSPVSGQNNVIDIYTPSSGCSDRDLSFGQVLNQDEDGYLEFNVTNRRYSTDVKVGLTIDNKFYGFNTREGDSGSWPNEQATLFIYRNEDGASYEIDRNRGEGDISYDLRLQRDNGVLKYYMNNDLVGTVTIPNGKGNDPATLTTHSASNNTIHRLKVYRTKTTQEELTTQVVLSLSQPLFSSRIRTKVTVAQRTANETLRNYIATSETMTRATAQKGIDLKFNIDFKTQSATYIVNNEPQDLNSASWSTASTGVSLPLIPILNQNQLGGSINYHNMIAFDMCYFNYGITPNNATASQNSFDFDDATSRTETTNPTKSSTNTPMTVVPAALQRILGGICADDTDQDGIPDMFEDIDGDGNLSNDDTDGDGVPNYMDPDDDGDGVATKFEGAVVVEQVDAPYYSTTASLNTDGDNLPNYLDTDDDGDGVDSVYEGTNPDHDLNPSTGPTLDTDHDGIFDYLDVDDDGDGLYTMYEGANPDGDRNPNTGLTLNTDHYTGIKGDLKEDKIWNYLDNDDDGDGVLTQYENADDDGDHNPFKGIAPLNTNGSPSIEHPKMIVNDIPNYLDADDDGDGYQTWEEGANPDGDKNPNTGATLDTDQNGIPDYLDYQDRIYPDTEAIQLNNYANLVGDKRYELSNHLGNVLSVISDKKLGKITSEPIQEILNNYDFNGWTTISGTNWSKMSSLP